MTEEGRARADTRKARPSHFVFKAAILVGWTVFILIRCTIRLNRVFGKVGL